MTRVKVPLGHNQTDDRFAAARVGYYAQANVTTAQSAINRGYRVLVSRGRKKIVGAGR
jgi:hypothetical protein